MKHLKLFESFSNVNKIEAVNNILVRFIIVNRLKTLNLKSITIEIDISSSEHLIFYYAKNNAGEKLFGFVQQSGAGNVGYFSTEFIDYLKYSDRHEISRWAMTMSSVFAAFKIYFNIDKLEITNALFIRKRYDRYIDLYEHEPPISKGGLVQKLIEWLDSGKETSKEEFFRAKGFIKTVDANKPFFELPKGYYYGYLSQQLAKARRFGLIDFVRRGKNTIIVKGKNFEEIKNQKRFSVQ